MNRTPRDSPIMVLGKEIGMTERNSNGETPILWHVGSNVRISAGLASERPSWR